jgi:hypothetical protein
LNQKTDYKFYTDVKYGEYQRATDNTQYDLVYATKQSGQLTEINNLLGGLVGFNYVKGKSKYKLNLIHLQSGESRAGQFNISNNSAAVGQSGYDAVSYNLEYNQRSLTNLLLNGKHNVKNWNIDWRLSPTYSTSTDPDIRKTPFSYDGSYSFSSGEAGNPSRIWRNLNELNHNSKIDVSKEYKNFKLNFGLSHIHKLRNYEIKLFELMFSKPQSWISPDPNLVMNTDNLSNENEAPILRIAAVMGSVLFNSIGEWSKNAFSSTIINGSPTGGVHVNWSLNANKLTFPHFTHPLICLRSSTMFCSFPTTCVLRFQVLALRFQLRFCSFPTTCLCLFVHGSNFYGVTLNQN